LDTGPSRHHLQRGEDTHTQDTDVATWKISCQLVALLPKKI